MHALSSYVKRGIFVAFLCLVFGAGYADTLTLPRAAVLRGKVPLRPFLCAWEDKDGHVTPQETFMTPDRFVALDSLKLLTPTSVYWLKTTIKNTELSAPTIVLGFSNLTYVDAWLFSGRTAVWHGQAGAFRPHSRLREAIDRFHLNLPLSQGATYTLLLRVHHTKGYQPQFDFFLQSKDAFTADSSDRRQADAWFHGAIALFFVYTLLSLLVSRYRSYRWLMLFIAGIGGYGLCSGPYFIDWFFPEHPSTGWLFNGPFLHLGLLGFYLLVVDFWQLRQHNPIIYRFGKLCLAVLVLLSFSGTAINAFTGNFSLVNTLNLWAFIFPFVFILCLLVCCYKRLDRAQKYLYYGIVLFLAAGLYITLSSALLHERALRAAPYVSDFTALAVFLLFSTGLTESLRQHEIEKRTVLEQLTRLQKQQNTLLEKKVEERTEELQQTNTLLGQRNTRIETLMNELSHRVKNNLQLLYSLSSLQLPFVHGEMTSHILKGNMARIKAMMLVNQKLDYAGGNPVVSLAVLTTELTSHLQAIYDPPGKVTIRQDIPEPIKLPSRQLLSLGLILTELLTNSFKYAFEQTAAPCIMIAVSHSGAGGIQVVYADNGSGFRTEAEGPSSSLGLSLIKDLTRQLKGTISTSQNQGLRYTIVLPWEQ